MTLSAHTLRADFPILHEQVHGKPLVYLDNAATTQKPEAVIQAVSDYYRHTNANVHRGLHYLSEQATQQFEHARTRVAEFIQAPSPSEIVFVRGTTEAINLVAQSYGRAFFQQGDEIILSMMEHHSNIVPWQLLRDQLGVVLRVVPVTEQGELAMQAYAQLLNEKTRLVALTHVANALGTINPVQDIVGIAHQQGVPVLLDGAQAVAHGPVDVQALGCDFYAFSAHKMYGPTGIGALYAKAEHLEKMPPYQGGGDMITRVDFSHAEYQKAPYKFEAGTPNIAGAIGFGAAIDYLMALDWEAVRQSETALMAYAADAFSQVPEIRLIGAQAQNRVGVFSWVWDGVHPHDIGTVLDREGVAVRAGHHCTMPLMTHFQLPATVRVSLGLYNTRADIDAFMGALERVRAIFS